MALITVTSWSTPPAGDSLAGDFFTYNAPAHLAGDTVEFLSRNKPHFISPLLWPPNGPELNPMDYEVWGVLQQRVYRAGFATSTTCNSVSSRSGVASTRTSLTKQFDSGVFDYACVSVQTAATLSTNCN